MSLKPPRMRKSKSHGQDLHKILVEPTAKNQATYNQVRDEEARHEKRHHLEQHVTSENYLCPADPRAPPMARSITNDSHISESMSPASTTDVTDFQSVSAIEVPHASGKRLRGRRHGPLPAGKRFKTAIKRKLGLVCKQCKEKKVVCDHYDLSKLEEAYQASKRVVQTNTVGPSPTSMDFLGFGSNGPLAPDLPPDEDLASDLSSITSMPNSRQQDLCNFITSFDSNSVSVGTGTLQTSFGRSYNPGLSTPAQLYENLSPPFPIGSETPTCTGQWTCKYRQFSSNTILNDECRWTGSVEALKRHFAVNHCSFQEEECWLRCQACGYLSIGTSPPAQCFSQNCYGTSWSRWIYGHTLVRTPALTQSGESESGFSFDASGNDVLSSYQYGYS